MIAPSKKRSLSKKSDFDQLAHAVQSALGYTFQNLEFLKSACHIKSVNHRQRNLIFERLEFLGDRVLGLAMAEVLSEQNPKSDEGALAKQLSALVSKTACQQVAETIQLKPLLEHCSGIKIPHSNALSDAVEALLGAVLKDGGYTAAHRVVQHIWSTLITHESVRPKDPKTALQEYTQKMYQTVPTYTIVSRTGPDHAPSFILTVEVQGPLSQKPVHVESVCEDLGLFCLTASGQGDTKRKAEQDAAHAMMMLLIQDYK